MPFYAILLCILYYFLVLVPLKLRAAAAYVTGLAPVYPFVTPVTGLNVEIKVCLFLHTIICFLFVMDVCNNRRTGLALPGQVHLKTSVLARHSILLASEILRDVFNKPDKAWHPFYWQIGGAANLPIHREG
jgi:hypothetical protein